MPCSTDLLILGTETCLNYHCHNYDTSSTSTFLQCKKRVRHQRFILKHDLIISQAQSSVRVGVTTQCMTSKWHTKYTFRGHSSVTFTVWGGVCVRFPGKKPSTSTSIIYIYSQQSFMIITGRRMSGCYTCYKIKMDCIDL